MACCWPASPRGYPAARLLAALPAAWLARRLGSRRLLVGSPALTAPVAALCALPGGLWALALFCLVEGAAAAVFATIGTAAVAGASPEERGRSLAAYQAAGLFGAAAGPAIGGLVSQQWGPRAPFLLYAVLAALAAGWLQWRLHPEGIRRVPALPIALAADARNDSRPVWRLFGDPRLLPFWLIAFALVFTRVGTQLVIAPLLGAGRLGLQPRAVGLALSMAGVGGLATFYPAGWLADRHGRKAAVVPGGLAMVAALALLATSTGYVTFALAALLLGAGSGLVGPAPAAHLVDHVPDADHLTGVALYRTSSDLGATLAPPLLGVIMDRTGYDMAILAAAALLSVAAGAFVWLAPAPPATPGALAPSQHDTRG